MAERITTDRGIAALKPSERPYERPVGDVKGLIVRVFPTTAKGKLGAKNFELRYVAENGARRRFPIGPYPGVTLAEAVKKAERKRVEIGDGADPAAERAERRNAARTGETLTELADAYFLAAAKGLHGGRKRPKAKQTLACERNRFNNHIKPALGSRRFAELKRGDLKAYMTGLAAEGRLKPGTISTVGRTLSAILAFAVEQERLEVNPIAGLTTPVAPKPSTRRFDEEAVGKLWRALSTPVVVNAAKGKTGPSRCGQHAPEGRPAADHVVSLALRYMLATLVRRGECVGATWAEVDLKTKGAETWTVPAERCKNRRIHVVPLSSVALEILKEARKLSGGRPGDFVFPAPSDPKKHVPGDTVTQATERTCRRLKIPHGSPHDFRRTAATILASEAFGVGRSVISALLSHTPSEGAAITSVYIHHDYLPEQRAALEAWGAYMLTLADGPSDTDASANDNGERADAA